MSSFARAVIFSGEDVAAFETSSATLSPVKDGLSPNAGPAEDEDEDEEEEEEEEEFRDFLCPRGVLFGERVPDVLLFSKSFGELERTLSKSTSSLASLLLLKSVFGLFFFPYPRGHGMSVLALGLTCVVE